MDPMRRVRKTVEGEKDSGGFLPWAPPMKVALMPVEQLRAFTLSRASLAYPNAQVKEGQIFWGGPPPWKCTSFREHSLSFILILAPDFRQVPDLRSRCVL